MDNIIAFKSLTNKKNKRPLKSTMTEQQIPITLGNYALYTEEYTSKQEVIDAFYSGEEFKFFIFPGDNIYAEYKIKCACLFTKPNETIRFWWFDEAGEPCVDEIKVNPLKINFFKLLSKIDLSQFIQKISQTNLTDET